MSDDTLKWIVGLVGGAVGSSLTLLVASFRIGKAYGALENATKRLEEALVELKALRERIARVDIVERTIAQLENVTARMSSDIRDLMAFRHRIEGRQSRGDDDE